MIFLLYNIFLIGEVDTLARIGPMSASVYGENCMSESKIVAFAGYISSLLCC